MRRFFAQPDQFSESGVLLDTSETRHLRDVLRLKDGENVHVFDGEGREFECLIETIGKKQSSLRIINEVSPSASESMLDLTLAASLLKGDKFDTVVQKAVELGVIHLVPMITGRCDVKLKGDGKRVERWRKIALEATKQCGRARLMTVAGVTGFAEFINSDRSSKTVLFSERDGGKFDPGGVIEKITAVVGPEGGWDDSEIEKARDSGVEVVTLGGRMMRAETASIAIATILQHRFGDIN
ncbi:MAG: 16S rRNA (uracil(1498)-N(3))-methyltransferase [Blastocatellia bacterium]